jgi:hypothetical protein
MKKLYSLICVLFLTVGAFAQDPYFELFVLSTDYVPLSNSTSLTQGIPYDDPEYEVNIGFEFDYLGNTFSNIIFGGYDGYGCELLFYSEGFTPPMHQISPYMMDIIDGQLDNNGKADSDIRYITEGEPGSRIFKLEWSNVGFYNEGSPYAMRMNLQVWLYEQDSAIEFYYGPRTTLDHSIISDYEGVPVSFMRNFSLDTYTWEDGFSLMGDPANPAWSNMNDEAALSTNQHLTETPSNGTVYRFFPLLVGVEETELKPVSIYPNPASDFIQVNRHTEEQSKATIYNSVGQIVWSNTITGMTNRIDLNGFSKGAYILQIENKNTVVTERFIVR